MRVHYVYWMCLGVSVYVREGEYVSVWVCECMCSRAASQTWYLVRLLDFSGDWDEALETDSVFPSYSLQSVKADMRRSDHP